MLRYSYLSGADNGWSPELECLGFPRDDHAPRLRLHGSFCCDDEDFKAFFRHVVADTVYRPFQKPRVQYIFVERGKDLFMWGRNHFTRFYEHGRITTPKERRPAGYWIKTRPM